MSDKALGLSFGRFADSYARTRPDYSNVAVDRVISALRLDRASQIVDLGAGTGKLTDALTQRFAHVVAVEPDPEMRALLGAGALAGTAECIPLPDASMDAIFVGDAFHWFDAPRALREIARVLRPVGGLALLWNHWWEVDPPLPKEALDLLRAPYV